MLRLELGEEEEEEEEEEELVPRQRRKERPFHALDSFQGWSSAEWVQDVCGVGNAVGNLAREPWG